MINNYYKILCVNKGNVNQMYVNNLGKCPKKS